jgi:hypothetical protein
MANDPAPGEGRDGAAHDAGITRTFGWQDMFVRPEEYARHMGHADLLRERIDGRVGL